MLAKADGLPRLSVCIPNYNMCEWVEGAVSSAMGLAGAADVEVVVVDNCSTDGSRERLKRLTADPRLRVILADDHVHVADNWNRAVELSRGEWCVLLSADDELDSSFWTTMCSEVTNLDERTFAHGREHQHGRRLTSSRDPQAAVAPPADWSAVTQIARIVGGGDALAAIHGYQHRRICDRETFVREAMWNPIPLATTAFRREVFDQIGGFSRAVAYLDYDFWIRCVLLTNRPILALGVEGGTYFANRGGALLRSIPQGLDAGEHAACLHRMYEFLTVDEERLARNRFALHTFAVAIERATQYGPRVGCRMCRVAYEEATGFARVRLAVGLALFGTSAWRVLRVVSGCRKLRARVAVRTRLRNVGVRSSWGTWFRRQREYEPRP